MKQKIYQTPFIDMIELQSEDIIMVSGTVGFGETLVPDDLIV